MRIALVAAVLLACASQAAAREPNPNQIHIQEYERADGTRVRAHDRTMPNDRTDDNLNAPNDKYSSIIDYR